MDFIQQDFREHTLNDSHYATLSGFSSAYTTNYAFNDGINDVRTLQHMPTSSENSVICTIDEHEDPRSSLKRKLKATTIHSVTEKMIKNIKTDKWKQTKTTVKRKNNKNQRQSKLDIIPTENAGPGEKLNYALISEQGSYGKEKQDLVLCKNQNTLPSIDCTSDDKDSSLEAQLKLSRRHQKIKTYIERCKDTQLNVLDAQYLQHFKHAFTCPKLEDGFCSLPNCTNPQKIIDFVAQSLKMSYNPGCVNETGDPVNAAYRGQMNTNMVYKVVIFHAAVECQDRSNCKMPLCKDFDEVMEKLIQDSTIDSFYEVVFSNNNEQNNVFYKEGIDFQVICDFLLAKGAFGQVSSSWYIDHKGRDASVAIKKVNLTEKKEIAEVLGCSVPMLKQVKNCPNVLVPDLVLRSDKDVLMVMEKAELSLFDYMKLSSGLSVNAATSYMFQMAKGLNQIHDLGLTHGDVKVPNCVLMNSARTLKVIDLDTLKEEDKKQPSGTPGYAAPEVTKDRTVRKPADVHSLCSCIPVLLYGRENILKEPREKILQLVMEKDHELASIYYVGTLESPEKRITADALVKWFRQNPKLRKRWENYTAVSPPRKENTDEKLCECVFKNFFKATLDRLPNSLELD